MKKKKKIAPMITNATKKHPTNKDNVRRDNETKLNLKIVKQRRLTKINSVPNQCQDHPT